MNPSSDTGGDSLVRGEESSGPPDLSGRTAALLVEALLAADETSFFSAAELVRRGCPMPDEIIAAFEDATPEAVRVMCWVVEQVPDPRVVSPLVRRIRRGEEAIQDVLARALVRSGVRDAYVALDRAIREDDPRLRRAVLGAMAWRSMDRGPKLPRHLGRLLGASLMRIVADSADASERVAAAEVLRIWELPEATPALVAALADSEEQVRDAARLALERIARGTSRWATIGRDALCERASGTRISATTAER